MITQVSYPDYLLQGDKLAQIEVVAAFIDQALVQNFSGKQVVLRGMQSAKSSLSKQALLEWIVENGTDHTEDASENGVKASNKPMDLFGLGVAVQGGQPLVLPILEGFHKWAPKALERPQYPVDVWMIYDAVQLKNVAYKHARYKVTARDGWTFKDPEHKAAALLGIIEVI